MGVGRRERSGGERRALRGERREERWGTGRERETLEVVHGVLDASRFFYSFARVVISGVT